MRWPRIIANEPPLADAGQFPFGHQVGQIFAMLDQPQQAVGEIPAIAPVLAAPAFRRRTAESD